MRRMERGSDPFFLGGGVGSEVNMGREGKGSLFVRGEGKKEVNLLGKRWRTVEMNKYFRNKCLSWRITRTIEMPLAGNIPTNYSWTHASHLPTIIPDLFKHSHIKRSTTHLRIGELILTMIKKKQSYSAFTHIHLFINIRFCIFVWWLDILSGAWKNDVNAMRRFAGNSSFCQAHVFKGKCGVLVQNDWKRMKIFLEGGKNSPQWYWIAVWFEIEMW